MKKIIFLLLGILTGCEPAEWKDPDQYLQEKGIYCYPTLGGVDCYKRPVKQCVRPTLGYEGPPTPQMANE